MADDFERNDRPGIFSSLIGTAPMLIGGGYAGSQILRDIGKAGSIGKAFGIADRSGLAFAREIGANTKTLLGQMRANSEAAAKEVLTGMKTAAQAARPEDLYLAYTSSILNANSGLTKEEALRQIERATGLMRTKDSAALRQFIVGDIEQRGLGDIGQNFASRNLFRSGIKGKEQGLFSEDIGRQRKSRIFDEVSTLTKEAEDTYANQRRLFDEDPFGFKKTSYADLLKNAGRLY